MVDSSNICALNSAIVKLRSYVASNYSTKSTSYYFSILDGLEQYATENGRESMEIISDYYEIITGKPPYQGPETSWLKLKARALLMLIDVMNGDEPKREYLYNRTEYSGTFVSQLVSYKQWLKEQGKSNGTLRRKSITVRDFLRFLDDNNIMAPEQISVDCVLSYLQRCQTISNNNKRYSAYILRNFLTSPIICGKLNFDPKALLCGFRQKQNERLKSWYTTDELKMVMNAVNRTTKWGKTIYAMMLLACVYGLRVSDIRGLLLSSICWQKRAISLFQKKTKRYVELPLTDEAKFALLDYYKNVRPESSDPHMFIRHLHPYVPYSENDHFSSKVTEFFRIAGINTDNKHHGLHSMRFSLATELLAEGVAINEIAAILGHKTIKPTKEYVWSDVKHLKAAALEVPVYG